MPTSDADAQDAHRGTAAPPGGRRGTASTQTALGCEWTCHYSAGALVASIGHADCVWLPREGVLLIDGRLVGAVPVTLDEATSIAVETVMAFELRRDLEEAYAAHAAEIARLERLERPARGGRSARKRAALYVARMDASISGQGGAAALMRAAVACVRGFDLDDGGALEVMREFDARAIPQWGERELRRAVRNARRRGRMESGALLRAGRAS